MLSQEPATAAGRFYIDLSFDLCVLYGWVPVSQALRQSVSKSVWEAAVLSIVLRRRF